MTPGEVLYRDTRRVMQRQNRSAAVQRFTPYVMPGGPRHHAPSEPDLELMRYLVGGGGPPLSLTLDGVLRVPAELEAIQQRPPRPKPEVHSGCCHCAMGEQARAEGRARKARKGTRSTTDPVFDAHGHLFGASAADFLVSLLLFWCEPATSTFERIGWLTGDMAGTGIDHMVLSGFFDGTASVTSVSGDWVLGSFNPYIGGTNRAEVDYTVSFASMLNPDFFLPFANGFNLADTDPVGDLQARLDAWSGWKGIGEIIVQGHGTDNSALATELGEIFGLADSYGLVLHLHWDMGAVDKSGTDAATTFDRFCALIDAWPDVVVILAHCGLGPYNSSTDSSVVDAWKERIIGGGTVTGILLGTMGDYPERFLLGTDVETRSYTEQLKSTSPDGGHHFGIEEYVESVSSYATFLQYGVDNGYLSEADVEMIRQTNGEDLFGV